MHSNLNFAKFGTLFSNIVQSFIKMCSEKIMFGGLETFVEVLFVRADWSQRRYRGHDKGAFGFGAGAECSRVCGGHQDRHVSTERPPRHPASTHAHTQVPGMPESAGHG